MPNVLAQVARPLVPRSGEIGPVRREIIFEPLHEQPAPPERPQVEPTPQREPQPAEPARER